MPRKKKKTVAITTETLDPGEVMEYDTFEAAYAALMAQLEPGGCIDLHEESCALAADGDECDCTPHRMTKGALA